MKPQLQLSSNLRFISLTIFSPLDTDLLTPACVIASFKEEVHVIGE
jgi:hypothetical protein